MGVYLLHGVGGSADNRAVHCRGDTGSAEME